MSGFEIKKATRQGVKPLIGIYSESGCGKTYSALRLARGFVGPAGKIVMIDTESGRGSLYADVLPGGYETIEMRQPFSPSRYKEAVQTVEASGADICVVDSVSHEWEGQGGVTDIAITISKARADKYNKEWDGVVQFGDWKQPKMEHAKFMLALLQSPLPIIVCCRAKYKTRQVKGTKEMADAGAIQSNQVGKTVILKDEMTTPIQAEDFIYEMTCYLEVLPKHNIIVVKSSHPTLRDCFPKDRDGVITEEHGQLLAKWCQAAGTTPKPKEKPAQDDPRKAKIAELWKLLKPVRGAENNWLGAEAWLIGHKILADNQSVTDLTIEELQAVIEKSDAALKTEQNAP